jgi:hypothetical protein
MTKTYCIRPIPGGARRRLGQSTARPQLIQMVLMGLAAAALAR